jgi:hypothetical protein
MRLLPSTSRSVPARAGAGDLAHLGGPTRGALLLSFDGLAPAARDAEAELVLVPHEDGIPPGIPVTVLVDRVRPPGPAGEPAVLAERVAERLVGPDTRGPIRIDVSRLVRVCARNGVRHLDLALRVVGDGELLVTSAQSPDAARRPRLDLYVP